MSKKHHSKRSCLVEKIEDNEDLEGKKDRKRKHHKKHYKKHHKKHSKEISNEDISEKYVECDESSSSDYYETESEENCIDERIKMEYTKEEYTEEDCNCHIDDKPDKDEEPIEDCDSEVCEAKAETEILSFCPSTANAVKGIRSSVVIKAPVVLAEPKIQISIESTLKLENPALEIKRIIKNVYLEQCKLIPDVLEPCYGTLFIRGFIRKNIEYATKDCCSKGTISGKIRHTTVKIPFTCATKVQFTNLPVFINTPPPEQVEILTNNIRICSPCEEGIAGNSPCQLNLRLTEFFNEKVYCELVSAEIIESDFLENPSKNNCEFDLNKTYNNVKEKVVVYLTVKLLQNQQVCINR